MNFKNLVWKNLHARIWFLVSSIFMVLLFVVSMVVTQVPLYRNSIDLALGGRRAVVGIDRNLFDRDYNTKDEVYNAANALNVRMAEEGFVLLRNEQRAGSTDRNVLPLAVSENRVSVFGNNSVDLLYGGSGSGGGGSRDNRSIFDSLTAANFTYNTALRNFYNSSASGPGRASSPGFDEMIPGFSTGQGPVLGYTQNLINTYANYNDAALVVLTRIGGEGYDLPRTVAGTTYNTGNGTISGVVTGARHRELAPNGDVISQGGHYLQLCNNEVDLLLHVTEHFENVILIINSNNVLELGFLDSEDYWLDTMYGLHRSESELPAIRRAMQRMRGALWVGSPGGHGIMALGRILNGEVNPSGRTVNVHARNFRHNPTYFNFGNNSQAGMREAREDFRQTQRIAPHMGNAFIDADRIVSGVMGNMRPLADRNYFVEYLEGIYVGYRYYETRAFTDGAEWWDANVKLPFGWGLSYSTFNWDVVGSRVERRDATTGAVLSYGALASTVLTADSHILVDVRVTNASAIAGSDVVQLYISAPYTTGGIEKSHVSLAAFAKTEVLPAGANQVVTLEFSMYDIASYDFNDANGNGFEGWELEAGVYTMYISRHANSWQRMGADDGAIAVAFTVPEMLGAEHNATTGITGFLFRYNPTTGFEVINRFDDVSAGNPGRSDRDITSTRFSEDGDIIFLSRSDWDNTMPTPPSVEDRFVSTAFLDSFRWDMAQADVEGENNPWFRTPDQMPTQAAHALSPNEVEIKLSDFLPTDANGNFLRTGVSYDDPRWDAFLNQLTVNQMVHFTAIGAFGNNSIEALGIPLTFHTDGPSGWYNFIQMGPGAAVYQTAFYVSQVVMASTFNVELVRDFGRMVGNEALVGDARGSTLPYNGWYAPGANIHRSPFSGRNWEYFSEDPLLTGIMGAQVVLGVQEKGVVAFPKHFAMNDQESNRSSNGLSVWASEQSMREIYLRAFEIIVREGRPLGIMSTYTRLANTWGGGHYQLLNNVLRREWGFRGMVVTDFADHAYMNPNQMIRAGGDSQLMQDLGFGGTIMENLPNNATHVYALRQATKNILYTTVNSNAMQLEITGYRMALWTSMLLWGNILSLLVFLAWGTFALVLSYRKIKADSVTTRIR